MSVVHVKVHCDECNTDIDVTCEGVYLCMKNPSGAKEEGFLNCTHHADSIEVLSQALRYLLPDILSSVNKGFENEKFIQWLKDQGISMDKEE